MVSALWANDGFNDDKGTRANAIQEIEANFEEAVASLTGARDLEEEIDPDNPFFKQMKEGLDRLGEVKGVDAETVEAAIKQESEFTRYIDQQ